MTNPLNSVATDDGRYYERHGRKFISVTNVIDKALSKPALLPWAVKLTAEAAMRDFRKMVDDDKAEEFLRIYPDTTTKPKANPASEWKRQHKKVKDESAEKGTLIHAWAEGWVLGQEPDPPEGLETECLGIMRAFERYGIEPVVAECTVYSDMHEYAGTCDLFATVKSLGGVLAVLDYKTGKSAWPETALQLAAYRFAEYIGLPDDSDVPVPAAERAGVLHVGHTETKLIPYRADVRDFTAFLGALQAARWVVNDSATAMGVAL